MVNPLILKLEHRNTLLDEDRARLECVVKKTRGVSSHRDLIREGDRPNVVQIVMEGFACRYKIMPDGGRTIMALLVPGDFCDLHVALLGRMDHTIATMSPCLMAEMDATVVDDLIVNYPRITRALWWATLADEAILRDWLAGMGRRPPDRQMAHFFCELRIRLDRVGLVANGTYDFPVTQAELGDVLGLSPVHVNRTLQRLRADNLLVLRRGHVTIPDVAQLETFAEFDDSYLHLEPRNTA